MSDKRTELCCICGKRIRSFVTIDDKVYCLDCSEDAIRKVLRKAYTND